jgi:hypothetical protein
MRDTIELAREAGDVVVDSRGRETFSFDSYGLKAFEALVRADEREACAKVCEDHFSSDGDWCAKAIRDRGNT